MRKLIIGCGYLGRRVAKAWLQRGDAVSALTRSADSAAELRSLGIEPVLGDVTDADSLRALPDAETVLYAVGFDRSAGRTQREVSVGGLENALRVISPRVGRLIYTSSTSVYGQRDGEWIDESSPCEPTRPNGRVCLEAEQTVWRDFPAGSREAAGRRANVLRLAGLYGLGRLLRRIEALRSGEPLSGNPEAYLNLIHVDDAVQAVLACESRHVAPATCLVCDDRPATRREYFETLASLIGAPPPRFEHLADKAAGRGKRCQNRKLRAELGVELIYPTIAAGLSAAVRTDG